MMKTPLIAGNSFYKGQSAAKTQMSKVQRLDRKIVHPSGWKWGATGNG